MELKFSYLDIAPHISYVLIAPLWNWNYIPINHWKSVLYVLIAPLWNWNCVLMTSSIVFILVLIAPLWNWNKADVFACNNRTYCSNRTFMELKYWHDKQKSPNHLVLIAPLWNWNADKMQAIINNHLVLIAPLWNWNEWEGFSKYILISF